MKQNLIPLRAIFGNTKWTKEEIKIFERRIKETQALANAKYKGRKI